MRLDPDAAMAALEFARERHRVWERRQEGLPQSQWTVDPILAKRKFTNVFRVLDPGSQFPLRELYRDVEPVEILARAWLYRHTNLPGPWEALAASYGGYPTLSQPGGSEAVYEGFRDLREGGTPWSSGAYILRPESVGGKHVVGGDKLEFFTRRCRELFVEDRYDTVTDFFATENPAKRAEVLMRPEGVAGFMSMQILKDFHYTLDVDRENLFDIAGPGTIKGARNIAPGEDPLQVAFWLWEALADDGPRLGNRSPSLADCTNILCEWSKYVREAAKPNPPTGSYVAKSPVVSPVLPSYYR